MTQERSQSSSNLKVSSPLSASLFSKEGIGSRQSLNILDNALTRNRFQAPSGNSFGFYPTYVPPDIAAVHSHIVTNYGHDAFSPFGYRGGLEFIDHSIREVARDFFNCSSEFRGGLVMPSGTLAIQHVIQLALTEYYKFVGHDYLQDGQDLHLKPVILAPIHAQFLVERASQAAGLGANNIRYYNLAENYDTDYVSLQNTIKTIYENGETPVLNFLLGGDTQRGLVQNVQAIINLAEDQRPSNSYRPFNLVDSAPHGLSMWAQDRQGEFDFSIKGVDGLIINPQKSDVSPLGGTLLMLRDVRRLGSLVGKDFSNLSKEDFEEERITLESSASWMISRDASPSLSFFTTLLAKGTEWLKKERSIVLKNTNYFRSLITSRPDLFTLIPSDNNVVAFTVKGEDNATRKLAEAVNSSDRREQGRFIAYSPYIRARNKNEVAQAIIQSSQQSYTNYDGLWVTIYPIHTPESIQRFFNYLCSSQPEDRKN